MLNKVLKNSINTLFYLIFILLSLSVIFPLVWVLFNSFKDNAHFFLDTFSLPTEWRWENFVIAWEVGVGKNFFNSVLVTIASIILTITVSTFAAFALSRYEFKGRQFFFLLILSGLMLAPQVSLIPLFELLQKLNIYDTYWALILPNAAFQISFATFLIRSYLITLPREIEDAAYIDGCNSFQVFLYIIVPLSKPIIITATLMTGLFFWNEFMFALVFIESNGLKTIPVGLLNLKSHVGTDYGVMLAGLFTAAIPMMIVYIIFQKYFVKALSDGGLKG